MWEWANMFWPGIGQRLRHVAYGFAAGLVVGAWLL